MKLQEILKKKPSELTEEEKAFLQENADQLTKSQLKKFGIKSPDEDEEDEEPEEDEDEDEEDDEDEEEEGLDEKSLKRLIRNEAEKLVEKKSKSFEKNLYKAFEKVISKFDRNVDEQRKKAHDGGSNEKNPKADEKTRKFFQAVLEGDKAAAKALSTSASGVSPDDAQAGLLVPEELMTEIQRVAPLYGIARRNMRYLPFSGPGNTRTIPRLGNSVSVTWPGEKGAIKSSQPDFTTVTQTLKKIAGLVPFTSEILEDSAINLTELCAQLIAEAIEVEIDAQFFSGTGSPWTGIINNSEVTKLTMTGVAAEDITADWLKKLIRKVPATLRPGSKFYFHDSFGGLFDLLKDKNDRYIFSEATETLPGKLCGYSYEETDALPAVEDVGNGDQFLIFGNLQKGCVYGDKSNVRVKLLDQAVIGDTDDAETELNLATQDAIAMRFVKRVGYLVTLPAAIAVLEAGADGAST